MNPLMAIGGRMAIKKVSQHMKIADFCVILQLE